MSSLAYSHSLPFPLSPLLSCTFYNPLLCLADCDSTLWVSPPKFPTMTCPPPSFYFFSLFLTLHLLSYSPISPLSPAADLALTQVLGSLALTPQSVATVYSKWNTRDQMMQKKKPNMGKVMTHQIMAVMRSRNMVPSGSKGWEAVENIL